MIRNDASGNINGIGYKPGQLIDLVRNPNWSAKTSWRPAHADEVLFKEGYQDPTVMTRTILSGSADVNGDSPPPPAELRSIMTNSSERGQLHFTPSGGSRYIALNTSKPPFDKLQVRQAVAYVLDRNAMRLTRGGAIDGRIATHFLDPSFKNQGFAQAGGLGFNPFPSAGFRGNVAKAKALLRKAGFANGMYKGPQVTMVADNSPPGSNTAQVVAADMAKIGFDVKTISVTHSTMYTKYCNVPKNEPNICPNVGWLPDFHEPQAVLDVTFAGNRITPVNNSNWPLLNDPKINAAIAHAKTIVAPQARWAAWGKIDRMVTQSAAAVPWIWENFPSLYSKRVTPRLGAVERRLPRRDVHVRLGLVGASRPRRSTPALPPPGPARPGEEARSGARSGASSQSSMLRYVCRRILWGAFLLVVVSALTFVIFTVFPSADPAALRAGRQATPELIAQIRHNLGLDKPLYVQYWLFLKGIVLHFDLGYSYQNSVSVKSQIFTRLPVTLSLTAGAFVIWMIVAIPIGVISAIRSRSLLDRATMGAALVAISAPVYFLGLSRCSSSRTTSGWSTCSRAPARTRRSRSRRGGGSRRC